MLIHRHMPRQLSFHIPTALWLGVPICAPHVCVCGENVDQFGTHGCSSCRGWHSVNNLIKRALASAEISSRLEPLYLSRNDRKHPETSVPWSLPSAWSGTLDVQIPSPLSPASSVSRCQKCLSQRWGVQVSNVQSTHYCSLWTLGVLCEDTVTLVVSVLFTVDTGGSVWKHSDIGHLSAVHCGHWGFYVKTQWYWSSQYCSLWTLGVLCEDTVTLVVSVLFTVDTGGSMWRHSDIGRLSTVHCGHWGFYVKTVTLVVSVLLTVDTGSSVWRHSDIGRLSAVRYGHWGFYVKTRWYWSSQYCSLWTLGFLCEDTVTLFVSVLFTVDTGGSVWKHSDIGRLSAVHCGHWGFYVKTQWHRSSQCGSLWTLGVLCENTVTLVVSVLFTVVTGGSVWRHSDIGRLIAAVVGDWVSSCFSDWVSSSRKKCTYYETV